jgi:hypothetical protein
MEVMSTGSDGDPLSAWSKDALKLFERMRGKDAEHRITRFVEYREAICGPDHELRIREKLAGHLHSSFRNVESISMRRSDVWQVGTFSASNIENRAVNIADCVGDCLCDGFVRTC